VADHVGARAAGALRRRLDRAQGQGRNQSQTQISSYPFDLHRFYFHFTVLVSTAWRAITAFTIVNRMYLDSLTPTVKFCIAL
jgi:hypothetical protein